MKVKVSLVKCEDYNQSNVERAIRQSLKLIGGLGQIIKRGDKVLLKPNVLSPRSPNEGVTTHPSLVKAMVKFVQEVGGKPYVGDSCEYYGSTLRALEVSGIKKAAEEAGAKVLDLDQEKVVEVKNPTGNLISTLYIYKPALEADVIINVPKLKTHSFTRYTGAIKNLLGLIPDTYKSRYHRIGSDPERFAEILAGILMVVRPRLAVMDAIIAMEGPGGPTSGDLRKVGLIIASFDSVALDAVVSVILGLSPFEICTTRAALKHKLITDKFSDLEILGESLKEVIVKDFSIRSEAKKVRPWVDLLFCTACGECVARCPVGAIKISAKRAVIDYHYCIGCFCCQEICSQKAVKPQPLDTIYL